MKCKYCGKTITFVHSNNGRPVPVEPGVRRVLYNGERVKAMLEHTCPDYEKRNTRRDTLEKYQK